MAMSSPNWVDGLSTTLYIDDNDGSTVFVSSKSSMMLSDNLTLNGEKHIGSLNEGFRLVI